ncbi:MAG: 3-hydroxyacyl-CoA dehydrogenase family protein [Solirubrobacterales bacterium]
MLVDEGDSYQRIGIAGGGVIAAGIAACASAVDDVILLARDEDAAMRAEERAVRACTHYDDGNPERIYHTTDLMDMTSCDLVIEAIVEELEVKGELLAELAEACPAADLATTTSSLSITELGDRADAAERFCAFHVFNPVTQMKLVELCFTDQTTRAVRSRISSWSRRIGKKPIEVPDSSGFVVNRLLFPYLFDAVRFMENSSMRAADVDQAMTLGAGFPMGPLALLDFVGLDVAISIGESLHEEFGYDTHCPPPRLRELVDQGKLGRKSGSGFYDYG